MQSFLAELRTQRWDDHRYYHHSRINQSLHLLSAVSFIIAYVTAFTDPAKSALIGWLVSMVSRQSGHFFFEPKGYDAGQPRDPRAQGRDQGGLQPAAQGDPARRLGAVALRYCGWIRPSSGCFTAHTSGTEFVRHVGEIWLIVGIGALLFRTVHLFFLKDVQTGLVWLTKIITDPFNDVKTYYKAPFYLMRGELIDPMGEVEAEAHRA